MNNFRIENLLNSAEYVIYDKIFLEKLIILKRIKYRKNILYKNRTWYSFPEISYDKLSKIINVNYNDLLTKLACKFNTY